MCLCLFISAADLCIANEIKCVLYERRLFSLMGELFIKSWMCESSNELSVRSIKTPEALVDAALMETKRCLNTNKPWHHNPQPSTRYPRTLFKRYLMAMLVLYKTLIRDFNWFGCVDSRVDWLRQTIELVWWFVGVTSGRLSVTNMVMQAPVSRRRNWLGQAVWPRVFLWLHEVILSHF